jgi:type I restriction enzyme M protein
MNMIMHGDGHGGVHHHDGLLNINGIFENRFDIIITNPPFGARLSRDLKITETDKFVDKEKIQYYTERYGDEYVEAMKQVNDNIDKKLIELYDLGETSNLTEVLFMERCLKLLKKGGRMGIVLPEGVLNNSALQKVREYFESRAKIVLICSIPQDVFIAAGATVKPSLLFMKKFTEEEELQYGKISKEVTARIGNKYQSQIDAIRKDLKKMKGSRKSEEQEQKKKLDTQLKEIEAKRDKEIKVEIKNLFDYEIAIVQVDKAGITATGAPCENELPDVAKEFKEYRKTKKLWETLKPPVLYSIEQNDVFRIAGEEKLKIYV